MHANVFLGVKCHLIVQPLRLREMLAEGRIALLRKRDVVLDLMRAGAT